VGQFLLEGDMFGWGRKQDNEYLRIIAEGVNNNGRILSTIADLLSTALDYQLKSTAADRSMQLAIVRILQQAHGVEVIDMDELKARLAEVEQEKVMKAE
jgi:hypothetical protein